MEKQKGNGVQQNLSEQSDVREKQWQLINSLLRQCLSQVTLAAQGVDTQLDTALLSLRKLVTQQTIDPQKLHEAINAVSESITQYDAAKRTAQGINRPQELILQWLDSLAMPPSLIQPLKQLRHSIERSANIPSMSRPMHELAEQLNNYFQQTPSAQHREIVQAPSQPSPPGILQRLLGGLFTARYTDQQLMAEKIRSLREFCLMFLDLIRIPQKHHIRLAGLKDRLAQSSTEEDISNGISALAAFISELQEKMESEAHAIQDFLLQLTENLQQIDQDLVIAGDHHLACHKNGQQLDEAVHLHVQQIEKSVTDNSDPSLLKVEIQERLQAIRNHLTQFRETEQRNQQLFEERLEKLNSRIHSIESESEHLRLRLREKHELAMKDPLTGLPNRLAYRDRMVLEYSRWKRYGTPLTLLVVDIDHFKNINDTYGHNAGDKALKLISRQMQLNLREADFLARHGGEEFVIVMPQASLDSALIAANKLREAIAESKFHYDGANVTITVSIGLASLREQDNPEKLFERADQALLKAKQNGRNRCEVSSD